MSLHVDYGVVTPEEFAGNLLRQDCYAYFGDRQDLDEWGIWYTRCRDSGLLQESNADAIHAKMQLFIDAGDAYIHRDNHWVVGWVEGLMIRVYKPGTTETTAAFQTMLEIREKLDGYPVLDEEDWSQREHDATIENIRGAGGRFLNGKETDRWVYDAYDWFWQNDQSAIECRDDGGGYPDDEQMKICLLELGLLDEDHLPDGYVPLAQRPNWEREPNDLPGQGRMF